jgi:hypothetical protein
MKLGEISKALVAARGIGVDGTDLMILDVITGRLRNGEEVTVMSLSKSEFASFGTVHARVQRLINSGFLTKTIKSNNQRVKTLGVGPKMEELETVINNVE